MMTLEDPKIIEEAKAKLEKDIQDGKVDMSFAEIRKALEESESNE